MTRFASGPPRRAGVRFRSKQRDPYSTQSDSRSRGGYEYVC